MADAQVPDAYDDEGIAEPKDIEDVLGLLHIIHAWIRECFEFVVSRDEAHQAVPADLSSSKGLLAECEGLIKRLTKIFAERNTIAINLKTGIIVVLKKFYQGEYLPKLEEYMLEASRTLGVQEPESVLGRRRSSIDVRLPLASALLRHLSALYTYRAGSMKYAGEPVPLASEINVESLRSCVQSVCIHYIGARTALREKITNTPLGALFKGTKHAEKKDMYRIFHPIVRNAMMRNWLPLP